MARCARPAHESARARTVTSYTEGLSTMNEAILMINDQRIPLNDQADPDVLIANIMAAVIDGGGFVHINGQGGNEYDVLVTPVTRVIVRHTTVSTDAGTVQQTWTPAIDLDV